MEYTLTPSPTATGRILDYGLAFALPREYAEVIWLGQGPFSQTPDKKAYNNRSVWQLHKDDIRFYGNRAETDLMAFRSEDGTMVLWAEGRNVHLENLDGNIVVTDNLIVGTYGTKFTQPVGRDAGEIGVRKGRILLKSGAGELIQTVFGNLLPANPEQPYLDSYGGIVYNKGGRPFGRPPSL